MQNRLFYVDFIKFLAITLVTGYHVWRTIGFPKAEFLGVDFWGIWKNGYMGCDLFFLLSGYLCIRSWNKIESNTFSEKIKVFYKNKRGCPR